ncbi:Ig-like domain-containing protein [Paenibacillus hexagrammi]|uniref:Ig-like domain-containing protein n=1 Tax=Paenibacillus hexagrammi TaxID=2908839 RepID=A0ABY3SNZ3_9BACL|nr:Ig-like domain-containing protein [Paenibacillus sp. YPD9-1]UJF34926.1 Ig-like domain-containing protein [Paenibacillus sp. YPD9-1]
MRSVRVKMKRKSGILAVSLLAFSLVAGGVGVSANEPVNYVQNPGFEDSNSNAWVFQDISGAATINGNNTHAGSKALNYWLGSPFEFTVSQTITGLPDGRYSVSASVEGGGGESEAQLFAKDFGGAELTSDYTNTGWAVWSQPQITHINVVNGQCTIGFHIKGNSGNWGSMDDVVLTRIGELETDAVPLTINPIEVDAFVHDVPSLPSVIKAVYADDQSAIRTPVQWEAMDSSTFASPGTFTVQGSAEGFGQPVTATVHVTYKPIDLNGDSVVNALDLAWATYALHAHIGDAKWDEVKAADINNDGVIDQADLGLIVAGMVSAP